MTQYLSGIALVIDDYDRAISFYQNVLQFELLEDTKLSDTKRWVVMKPNGSDKKSAHFILAKASNALQKDAIGNQSGGRVFLFLKTTSFDDDIKHMKNFKVEFIDDIRHETYGRVTVFKDLYGNKWDLIECLE